VATATVPWPTPENVTTGAKYPAPPERTVTAVIRPAAEVALALAWTPLACGPAPEGLSGAEMRTVAAPQPTPALVTAIVEIGPEIGGSARTHCPSIAIWFRAVLM
jgi:hypothetical protein